MPQNTLLCKTTIYDSTDFSEFAPAPALGTNVGLQQKKNLRTQCHSLFTTYKELCVLHQSTIELTLQTVYLL